MNRRRKSESSQHRSKTMASMKEKGLSGKVIDSENASSYHLECRSPFCRCTRWKQDVASRDISLNSINREEIDFNSISFLVKKRILIFNMYLFLSSFFFFCKAILQKERVATSMLLRRESLSFVRDSFDGVDDRNFFYTLAIRYHRGVLNADVKIVIAFTRSNVQGGSKKKVDLISTDLTQRRARNGGKYTKRRNEWNCEAETNRI